MARTAKEPKDIWQDVVLPPVPPRSEVKIHELEDEIKQFGLSTQYPVIADAKGEKFWAAREELTPEKFIQYWDNPKEAEIAWKIIHMAKEHFDRPQLRMFYPNDPMFIYAAWHNDSLDDVEYIIVLEQEFNTKIPDEVFAKFLCTFTIQEAVQYLIVHAK